MEVGRKLIVPVSCGGERIKRTGTIVYVHPEKRFVVVEFDFSGRGRFYGEHWHRKFRESYHLVPPKDRLCSSLRRKNKTE